MNLWTNCLAGSPKASQCVRWRGRAFLYLTFSCYGECRWRADLIDLQGGPELVTVRGRYSDLQVSQTSKQQGIKTYMPGKGKWICAPTQVNNSSGSAWSWVLVSEHPTAVQKHWSIPYGRVHYKLALSPGKFNWPNLSWPLLTWPTKIVAATIVKFYGDYSKWYRYSIPFMHAIAKAALLCLTMNLNHLQRYKADMQDILYGHQCHYHTWTFLLSTLSFLLGLFIELFRTVLYYCQLQRRLSRRVTPIWDLICHQN